MSLNIWTQPLRRISIDFPVFEQQMGVRFGPDRVAVAERWRTLLEDLSEQPALEQSVRVNDFFHRTIRYRTDQQLYRQEDYWASPLETLGNGLGDCEDWAIAKYITLRYLGVSDDQLRLIYVRARLGGARSPITQAHMVLGYYPSPDEEPIILDSLISSVLPASERTDLSPVFSFNSRGLWVGQGSAPAAGTPTARLSLWRDVIARMQQEGIQLQ
ncbi:MAG: transglutaminase-like cysteine peptidase [Wenzhouxiangella sp.]|nr:transglutaminase-like cysteine peptidase [Wenzhouxiangella sp.]